MIFFELLLFLFSISVISLSFAGYGSLLLTNESRNLFLDIFLGFIIVSLIVTLIHFFSKINLIISILVLIFGLIAFYRNSNLNYLTLLKKKNLAYLLIILLFLPMYISQKYHEDFGYYHFPYALALIEEKIIFGFANIDKPFVYNSLWLNLKPLFFLENKNFNFLTVPSFLLYISFILFSINEVLKKKDIQNSDYFLVVVIFYFILKFTRISEFGVDLPAIIFSVLAIYYFIKLSETKEISKKTSFFYLNFIFSVFSILIKLSTAPILLLTIYLYLFNFNDFKFIVFKIRFLVIYFLCFSFFTQQFIYTGCFLFPTNFSCLNVSWFNIEHLSLNKILELTNKSYSTARNMYSPSEYLSNYTWFPFWLKRNYTEILEHLGTIILPVLFFAFFLKKKNINKEIFNKKKIIYLFVFLNIIFWLNFSPVYRFGVHIFITLSFIILLDLLISREFSKKLFTFFVSIFLLFSFSKNIFRINNSDNIFIGIQKIENSYIFKDDISNEYAKIFHPDVGNNKKNGWQGRLCWNTPFICSYNKLDVSKKNGYLIINKLQN